MKNINFKLLSAIIGLARACEGNENLITSDTKQTLMNSLRALKENKDYSIESIHDEKKKLIPLCYECAMPCGRTFDYDTNQFLQESENIQQLKLKILDQVIHYSYFEIDDKRLNQMIQALQVIGLDDLDENYLSFVYGGFYE